MVLLELSESLTLAVYAMAFGFFFLAFSFGVSLLMNTSTENIKARITLSRIEGTLEEKSDKKLFLKKEKNKYDDVPQVIKDNIPDEKDNKGLWGRLFK